MKKVFISADIEGTAGIRTAAETRKGDPVYYPYFSAAMTREVAAVCDGAFEAGATNVVVKDSHGGGDNIDPAGLPRGAELIRGWGLHPYHMMFGLDALFDRVFMTGCHSPSGTDTSPLAHTNNSKNTSVLINGEIASEAYINSLTAAYMGVPTCLITGDDGICSAMRLKIPSVETVATTVYEGNAARSAHPDVVAERMKEAAARAMALDSRLCMPELPPSFDVDINFRDHLRARAGAYYPGALRSRSHTVSFKSDDWFEVLRFFFFVLSDNMP